jgi:Lysyl oxidase
MALKRIFAFCVGGLSVLCLIPFVARAVRTDVARDFPVYQNHGLPDLTIDPKRLVSQMEIVDRLFDSSSCEVIEGSIGGTGYRRLLRFDTVIINGGGGDLVVGSPTDPNNPYHSIFYYSPCHGHYHILGFSDYKLLRQDGSIAAIGHKQAFCLEDILHYSNDNKSSGYDCAFQGITTGWADWYFKQLSGQWIDITGVPEGDYIVRVEINAAHTFSEGANRYPNVVEAPVHVPDPRNKVTIDNSPAAMD